MSDPQLTTDTLDLDRESCPEHGDDSLVMTEAEYVIDEKAEVTVECRQCEHSVEFDGAAALRILQAGAGYRGFGPLWPTDQPTE